MMPGADGAAEGAVEGVMGALPVQLTLPPDGSVR